MAVKIEEQILPLLPLRGVLVFPTMVLHLDVGRDRSVQALEHAMVDDESLILLATQREVQIEEPDENDIYSVGTIAKVRQMLKLPNGTIRVLVEGLRRATIREFADSEAFYQVRYQEIEEIQHEGKDIEALMRTVLDHFEQYLRLSKKLSTETYSAVVDIEEPGRLADVVTSHLPLKIPDKQEILEILDVKERLEKLLSHIHDEKEVLELEKQISSRVKKQMEKTQKEYYLREQMKAIQRELGDKEGRLSEAEELREQLQNIEAADTVKEKISKEIDRLEKIPTSSAEGGVVRTYIEWLLELPWEKETMDDLDIHLAEKILDEDHYGLEKAKERVLEYLAVQKMVKVMKGPILCLAGPPGVGKTSLARSIARSLGRNFVRISLGGVRDEAEIRGHRRTYVGAMPGRIIQGMKSAGSKNPVFLLDEIDKMAMDFRGDPSSALLEVLDPNQNTTFSDHYIELPYDLSNVMFITTANAVSQIPRPLLDRMEVLTISGYTELEKEQIAKTYLYPKQLKEHGLSKEQMQIKREAMLKIIRNYTREAGVRNLERTIATLCRKAAKQLLAGNRKRIIITEKNLPQYLGAEKVRYGKAEDEDHIGVVTGLAWTEVGGDTLSIEVSVLPGKGKLMLTGKLGDVMQESAQAAFSYIRSRADFFNIAPDFHEKYDIHIHIPEGATPKDGPSAGITMVTAMVSALTDIPVSRDVAMTGEITLRGRVLPIGGLKEKSLSAHRAGIKHVLFPKENEKDLEDIPESILNDLTFTPVSHMDEVLKLALVRDFNESNKS
ncbi:endopeptidase La [Hazenella sp. IB182357]|uniref:Lon protease n=1 Tax=Polycladospora coralii TaxID=2771432 RepID=A0A926N825_9BACL|nr:endopeptidase La [Polycladospora coralii]MBD1371811.1 endopeptidase La [Polycladospora coralii]MBS7529272.1 endopeptidase La [Polycladospora coralii]